MRRDLKKPRLKVILLGLASFGVSLGCAQDRVSLRDAHLPPTLGATDSQASSIIQIATNPAANPAASTAGQPDGILDSLTAPTPSSDGKTPTGGALPPGSDGAAAPPPRPEKHAAPTTDRETATRTQYPQLPPSTDARTQKPEMSQLSLAQLQQLALSNNPRIRQANAEVDAARGHVLQAGLHPNPTVGYQVDQWQPNLKIPPGSTGSGVGQQGGFINQLIKTAGKLSLAQQVSGYDCINAMVAARKAEIAVMTQVRSAYFAVLVAQQSLETAATFAKLASDAYDVQIKRVAAGVAASHEPYQYHAQAILAQNAVTQAESARFVAWKHLAAALGQPDMPVATLVGRADVQAPTLDRELIQARMGENHTDLLTMRNQIAQAQANLTLQRRLLIPDLQTNTYHQYDNLAQTYQFGVQLGIQIPISDRNQGNIRTARAKLVSASEQLQVMEIELLNKLAEAHGRYETNRKLAISYREQVLPSLTQAYRGLVRQSQIEPEKASYSDITTARQNLYNTYQLYLGVLDAQWKALIDIAQLGQLDDLFLEPTSTK